MSEYPWKCVCYVKVGEKPPGKRVLRGSGWIARVGQGLVCTSGHNLRRPDFEAGWVHVWVDRKYPKTGARFEAKRWVVHERWKDGFRRDSDLALIDVGDLRPFDGFWFADRGEEGLPIETTGFPSELPRERKELSGTIAKVTPEFIIYEAPTKDGMSGGPVWIRDADGRPIVVGVHARRPIVAGGHGWRPAYAVRMTAAHVEWIKERS